jgi:hypothetical protein
MKESVSLLHRFLSAIVGFLVGGVLGMLVLYFVMLVVGSDFGLDNVRPGFVLGAILGFFLGLSFPERCWSWLEIVG